MTKIHVFVSSPGDVGPERVRAGKVMERLDIEYRGVARIIPYFWEHEPMRATTSFNDPGNIPLTSDFDVVVCILWSRLGTMLGKTFTRDDGTRFESGTVFEVETAARAYEERQSPDLLVYRKNEDVPLPLDKPEERDRKLGQIRELDDFVTRWFFDADSTFRNALMVYTGLAQFEQKLEQHLRRLIEQRIARAPAEAAGEAFDARVEMGTYHGDRPFRGLEAFTLKDENIFFGRVQAIDEVLGNMKEQAKAGRALTLVHGGSGSGKSSLVQAGVAPLVMKPGAVEGIGLWRFASLTPTSGGKDLLQATADALFRDGALPELGRLGLDAVNFSKELEDKPENAIAKIAQALVLIAKEIQVNEALPVPPEGRFLLVVDQLEELFSDEARFPEEKRKRFSALLAALARSGCVWTVLTMRSDAMAVLSALPQVAELTQAGGQYLLLPPSETDLSHIVRLPARAAGLVFEQNSVTGQKLDDRLLAEARNAPDGLPLLEFTLERLYAERQGSLLTHAALDALGGIEGAVASHAEAVFSALVKEDPAVGDALPVVFRSLVTLAPGSDAGPLRRVADMSRFSDDAAATKLISTLVEARLLTLEASASGTVVKVTHEALFRKWPKLKDAIAADKQFLVSRSLANSGASTWIERGRSNDFLWSRGKPLAEVRQLALKAADLNEVEREFVTKSLLHARHSTQKLLLGLGLGGLTAAGTLYFLWPTQGETLTTEQRTQIANVEKSQSVSELEEQLANALKTLQKLETDLREAAKATDNDYTTLQKRREVAILLADISRDTSEISRRLKLLQPDHKGALAATAMAELASLRAANVPTSFAGENGNEKTKVPDWSPLDSAMAAWKSKVSPLPASFIDLQAQIASLKGRHKEANILWRDYLKQPGISVEAKSITYNMLSKSLLDDGDKRGAELLLNDWIGNSDAAVPRVRRAKLRLQQLRITDAQSDLDAAAKKDPTNPEVTALIPQMERVVGLREDLERATSAIQNNSGTPSPQAFFDRSLLLLRAGQPGLALADIEQGAKNGPPGSATWRILRGVAMIASGQNLDPSTKINPLNEWRGAPERLAQWIESQRATLQSNLSTETALAKYAKSEFISQRVEMLREHSIAVFNMGQIELSMEDADAMAEIAKDSEDYFLLRSAGLSRLRRYSEALELLEQAIATFPQAPEFYRFKAESLLGVNKPKEALEACNKAIALRTSRYYLETRAECYRALGKNAEAEKDLAEANKLKEQQP